MKKKVWAIIAAAGRSERMKGMNKMFVPLLGKPLLTYAIRVFEECNSIEGIVIVAVENQIQKYKDLMNEFKFKKVKSVIAGGKERQDSVFNGLRELKSFGIGDEDIVVIHNGANPLVKEEEIIMCTEAIKEADASVAAHPVKDTIKIVDKSFVMRTLNRNSLWAMQTPQVIKFGVAVQAFQKASDDDFYGTDDVQLVERIGGKVKIVPCSYENFKITTPEDVLFAESILKNRGVKNV